MADVAPLMGGSATVVSAQEAGDQETSVGNTEPDVGDGRDTGDRRGAGVGGE